MHSFYTGKIADVEVVAAYSGCGKINASITAQLLIDRYQVDAIIFSGIAGGMKEEIEVFDTVVCTASAFHDTDNEIYADFPVMDEPIFYSDRNLVSLARKAAEGIGRKIHFGLATTGDRYVEPVHPDALCIDMETAAAAHTCYLNQVPFVAIRSISDNNKEQYIAGDFSCHLPQTSEGAVYQMFSSMDQLATILQARGETQQKEKEFLKSTISDISHQLKTPLAALTVYQEIIAGEPENRDTVKEFSAKMGVSLKRIKQLIEAMLKITRLDAGGIVFDIQKNPVYEVVSHGINELKVRAKRENKKIILEGDRDQTVPCDLEWTGEAIGNIVKNALDHTDSGGIVHIMWAQSPAMVRIQIKDNGCGILPEDLYHIFKRFYRSKKSLDTQGVGLGLPLAKAIVEGQKGVISVKSELGEGTAFTISFLTDS